MKPSDITLPHVALAVFAILIIAKVAKYLKADEGKLVYELIPPIETDEIPIVDPYIITQDKESTLVYKEQTDDVVASSDSSVLIPLQDPFSDSI